MVPVSGQKIIIIIIIIIFSYLACNQIWLNLPMDDGYVGYITKLTPPQKKKTLVWGKRKENPLVAHSNS